MTFQTRLRAGIVTAAVLTATTVPAADLVIGAPNWPSAMATAQVLKAVVEENLGLEVELQAGTNPVIFAAMASGDIHVHPEVWLPNQQNLHDKYVKEDGVVRMNPNGVESVQAICVTKATAERTGIRKLTDLTDPAMAAKFDTNGDGRGEMWIGVPGWGSTNAEKVRAKSYGYAETMELKELDETVALAELDAAVAQDRDFVMFCYTPHHMFALHDLVILEEPPHDPARWTVIQPTDDPQWLEKSSADVAWDTAYLHVHYATALEEAQPAVAAILSRVKLSTDIASEMTYAIVVEKRDAEEFARQWVKDNAALVDSWLR